MGRKVSLIACVLALAVHAAIAQEAVPQRSARPVFAAGAAAFQVGGAQGRQVSRKIRLGPRGRFSIFNTDGDIVITSGGGDDVEIEATKRGDPQQFGDVEIDVQERTGRVDVRTIQLRSRSRISVMYSIVVPASTSIDARGVSGHVRITGVQGSIRAESVSGDVTTSGTPKLELVKSISGQIDLTDSGSDAELSATTVSGNIRGRSVKVRGLTLATVSGTVTLADVASERVSLQSVSGNLEYGGTLARTGRYDFSTHSGFIRLILPGDPGFDLTASTFSGAIRSDLPVTIGGGRGRGRGAGVTARGLEGTFGDGSAIVSLRSFSGDITISKR